MSDSNHPVIRGRATINRQGRLVIPAECRAAAELAPGEEVQIEVVGKGELRLRSKQQAVRAAQEIVAQRHPKGRDLVAELIEERRNEAKRE
jgi:AbrB family looped-hinge helix DNA binding protein